MIELKPGSMVCGEYNIIPEDVCDELVSMIETSKNAKPAMLYKTGYDVAIVNEKVRKALALPCTPEEGLKDWVDKKLFEHVNSAVGRFCVKYGVLERFQIYNKGYNIVKYPKGEGFYDWHYDSMNANTQGRLFSMIAYLNTVKQGGQTEFLYQDFGVRPEKGMLIIFPSYWTHLHRGVMPVSEAKYILTSFCYKK